MGVAWVRGPSQRSFCALLGSPYMVNEPEQSSKALTPQETAAILQRILDAVEQQQRRRWVEVTCAVVLALAAMASAWCAYQANLWGGVQTFRLAAANKANRAAM